MNNQYDIRDISLAPSGHRKIQWVKHNMPLLSGLEEEFSTTKPFEGLRISLSVHLEAKTAYLCLVLAAGGEKCQYTGRCDYDAYDLLHFSLIPFFFMSLSTDGIVYGYYVKSTV